MAARRRPRRNTDDGATTLLTAQRRRKIGRPTRLTPTVRDAIVDSVAAGNAIPTAAQAAGVHRSTVYSWLTTGQDAWDAIQRGETVPDDRAAYIDFLDRVTRAYATAEQRAVSVIRRVMDGGELISEEPALNNDGLPIYDEDGRLVYKRQWTTPDGRLALEFISRTNPARWAKRAEGRLEIVGETGMPVDGAPGATGGPNVEQGAAIAALAERLHETMRRRAIESGDAAGEEPVDGEVVDEDDPAVGQ